MKVTKEELLKYVNLTVDQSEAFYNTPKKPKELSINVIEELTSIPKEKIIYIQEHLTELSDKYFIE